ncbi:MAG: stage V sporulation protein AD [Clostridia bacterium]|nr:stage V sporulation protein AD [Clostridia bacterium]
MAKRIGSDVICLPNAPVVRGAAAVGTSMEAKGPLGAELDHVFRDAKVGAETWEQAESRLQSEAVRLAIRNAGTTHDAVQLLLGGDLLNQCMATSFSARDLHLPLAGLYGACSTMALSLALAALLTECGAVQTAVACTSSHFCAAEKQFRMPLEYGGQRPPTAQWTATASGAAVVCADGRGPRIEAALFGRVEDYGVRDSANMGAAMAPAAASTIATFLRDTNTQPRDYDMILTGDLGSVGSRLLEELLEKEHGVRLGGVHADCGLMLYDGKAQDVHAGGSGCGCSAAVVCGYILRRLREGTLRRVLFVGTGALLSGVSPLQGETVPGVAHAVLLTNGEGQA